MTHTKSRKPVLAGPADEPPLLTDSRGSAKPVLSDLAYEEKAGANMSQGKRHRRNTSPMLASARCGARTRSGKPCRSPAVCGKRRCRMHGGAPGSGAPFSNKNALKHGMYTREALAELKLLAVSSGNRTSYSER